jgi:hypothetical protein
MQTIADQRLVGNVSGGTAVPAALTASQVSTFLGLAAIATSGSASDLMTGTLPAGRFPALTGDVTTSAGSVATTIANNAVTTAKINASAVTYAKIQNVTDQRVLGNVSGSAAPPSELTASQLSTLLALSTTYQPIISATATRVFFSGGGSTISTDADLTYNSTTNVLTVPTLEVVTVQNSTTDLALTAAGAVNVTAAADSVIDVGAHQLYVSANDLRLAPSASTIYVGGTSTTNTVTGDTTIRDASLANLIHASAGNVSLSQLTSNGFVKTSGGSGLLSVDTTSYWPTPSLTNKDVLYATGSTTVGQDSRFQFDTGTGVLSAPSIKSNVVNAPTGDLTLSTTAASSQVAINPVTLLVVGGTGVQLSAFTSNGFLKTSGGVGTLSVDTTSYETSSHAAATYQPLLSLSSGGVVYATGTSTVATDTSNNVWDATNKRLVLKKGGAYTPAAGAPLTIAGQSGVAFSTIAIDINNGGQTITCSDSTLVLEGHSGVSITGNGATGFSLDTARNVTLGNQGSLSTSATDGFPYIPSGTGAATGIPTLAGSGNVPLYFDRTNNRLYIHNGSAWKSVLLT